MAHFLDIADLTSTDLRALIAQAQDFIDHPPAPLLSNKRIANLFFEPSTRTRCSFDIAAKNLGADVINLDCQQSSLCKGETEVDTVMNLHAMGIDGFVIRHQQAGMVQTIAKALGNRAMVINAGCGTLQHPSQALLDMLTISQHFPDFSALSIAIIGDILHSRVAHSDIAALTKLGVKDIRLIAPKHLLPDATDKMPVKIESDLKQGLKNVNTIMTLRMQLERMPEHLVQNKTEFYQDYRLTPERLSYAKKNAIVMHPGPVNRDCEIASAIVDGSQSVILQQTQNGIPARMAILAKAFNML